VWATAHTLLAVRRSCCPAIEGLANKEIGKHLGIARDTAKFHVGRMIDKPDARKPGLV
jgi:FixJ family two-component response regulator